MHPPAVTAPDPALAALDRRLRSEGPAASLDELVRTLDERGEHRAMLDALLLQARHELGLPPVPLGTLGEIPEPQRTRYEDRYVEAIRRVGGRLLEAGDIAGAWPYFRAIAERDPVAAALEAYRPEPGDPQIGQVVEVAFNQGAHPRRGFEMILEHYGTCSAITAFEALPPDEATRSACAEALVRQLHSHLVASLRGDVERQRPPAPPEGTSIPDLIASRPWLFDDEAYHIDVSHLASVVRMSPLLSDPEAIRLAAELTDYGRHLSERHRYEGDPPFERLYEDHATYLRALLGQDPDSAVAHFRAKLSRADAEDRDPTPAMVLVRLLVRLGRLDEAIDVSAAHLADLPESALSCPSLAQLCARAGRPDRLASAARDRGDLVGYATALLSGANG